MKTKLLLIALLAFPVVGSSSCVLVGVRKAGVSNKSECRNDQYWDGTQCRHKGKGSGARKHDG
jgi:hypothetical protein